MRRSIAVAMMALGLLMAPSVAQADTEDIIEPQGPTQTRADGWQSGTCTSDVPIKCAPETPDLFFTTAGGHPPIGFTQYQIQHEPITPLPSPPFPAGSILAPIKPPIPNRSIRTLRVDLPPGLTVNPEATAEKCPIEKFEEHVDVGPARRDRQTTQLSGGVHGWSRGNHPCDHR